MRSYGTAVILAFVSLVLFSGFGAEEQMFSVAWVLAVVGWVGVFGLAWRNHLLHRKLDREIEGMGSSVDDLGQEVARQTKALRFAGQQLENQKHIIENLRMTDLETGLWARGHLDQIVAPLVARSLRNWEAWNRGLTETGTENRDLLAFLVELDQLSDLSEIHGVEAGRKILVEFADVLRASSRSTDILARWGDEQILVLRAGADRGSARQLSERLRKGVAFHIFQPLPGLEISTTCCIGFSGFPLLSHAPRALPFEKVLELAEWALGKARLAGKDRWVGVGGDAATPVEGLEELLAEQGPEKLAAEGKLVLSYSEGEGKDVLLPETNPS